MNLTPKWHFQPMLDGRPLSFCMTMGEVTELIADMPLHHADKITVWRNRHLSSCEPSVEITRNVAIHWAMKLQEATPEHMHPPAYHPFILANIGDELAEDWNRGRGNWRRLGAVSFNLDMIKVFEGELV